MMSRTLYISGWFYLGLLISNSSLAQTQFLKPLYALPYVVVYGRDSCPYTRNMKKELKREGIQFQYQIIDEPKIRQLIYRRMQLSGFSTKEFTLPVVDVSNEILVHPSPAEVIDQYNFGPAD